MNVEQLKYFEAITKYKTFLEAAEEMNISQSSLSKQLSRLEDELGVTLIDRSKRKASLTQAGKIFARDAEAMLAQYQVMLSHMQAFKKNPDVLKIGSLALLGQYGLNYKLADFEASHDEYKLLVEDVEEDVLIEGFKTGKYDLIIGRTLPEDVSCSASVKLADDELVAVMRKSHPLASKDSIELKKIISMPLYLTKSYTSIYKLCMQLFNENNLKPVKISTSRSETIISMIFTQNAIALLPRQAINIFQNSGLAVVEIRPTIKIPVMIYVRNKNGSLIVKDLIRALED